MHRVEAHAGTPAIANRFTTRTDPIAEPGNVFTAVAALLLDLADHELDKARLSDSAEEKQPP